MSDIKVQKEDLSQFGDLTEDEPTDPSLQIPISFQKKIPLSKNNEKIEPKIILPSAPPVAKPTEIKTPEMKAPEIKVPEFKPVAETSVPGLGVPGLGVIDPLLKDPEITEIMINDVRNIMIEKRGRIVPSPVTLSGLEELNRLTRRILDVTGKNLTPDQPYVDTMLPDGSRVNIVSAPITLYGPCITIRRFSSRHLGIEELIQSEMLDHRIAYFLRACVVGRLNILIAGGTGTGKTTLLNAACKLIPSMERVVTIEDTAELTIQNINHVRMQTKSQTPLSSAVTARDLLANALRMRPDRIIIGECRRGEAFDMLQAMNTGHEGSMTTLHANSARDALARMETLCLFSGVELPLNAIRRQMMSALDLIIQIKRFRNGKRRVVGVTELTGMEGDIITLQDIYMFDVNSRNKNQTENGQFRCTGFVPSFLDKLKENGVEFQSGFFEQG